MNYFEMLYAFQQFARRKKLAPSCRLVYLNLLARANIDGREVFEMDNLQLQDFTGLNKNTITQAKSTLKNYGFIDWNRYEILLGQPLGKPMVNLQKKVPAPSKKKNTNDNNVECEAGARANEVNRDDDGDTETGGEGWEAYYD